MRSATPTVALATIGQKIAASPCLGPTQSADSMIDAAKISIAPETILMVALLSRIFVA